jgi:aminoglycoside phosphotransferase (APT) family kinase protein
VGTADAGGVYPRHNWLPLVLPAQARRFRVADPKLASTIRAAGAELVESEADVEIAPAEQVRGDADVAIVPLDVVLREGGSRPWRAALRTIGFSRVRLATLAGRREVRRRGYETIRVVPWEWEQTARLPGGRHPAESPSLPERMPLAALVVGTHGSAEPTLLDEALAAASEVRGLPLEASWPLVRQGGLVVIAGDSVVRVAVGPASRELRLLRAALDVLGASRPPPTVAERTPWLRGAGAVGLAEWLLERRLPGTTPPIELPESILAECVDFLTELFLADGRGEPEGSLSASAGVIAARCAADTAEAVRLLGSRLDSQLADVPRGFGHGDFWTGNLLTDERGLSGVVDWHDAGPGRLPLIDLLHLRLSTIFQRRRQYLGDALVEHLLPWARAGGDEVARSYCRRIGLEIDPARLEALVAAYWITRTAQELGLYEDRVERPLWMRHNVEAVVPALASSSA